MLALALNSNNSHPSKLFPPCSQAVRRSTSSSSSPTSIAPFTSSTLTGLSHGYSTCKIAMARFWPWTYKKFRARFLPSDSVRLSPLKLFEFFPLRSEAARLSTFTSSTRAGLSSECERESVDYKTSMISGEDPLRELLFYKDLGFSHTLYILKYATCKTVRARFWACLSG